jgi:hypothetical protein
MHPAFRVLEKLIDETLSRGTFYFDDKDIGDVEIIELQEEFDVSTAEEAIEECMRYLSEYFDKRCVQNPIDITLRPATAQLINRSDAEFILAVRDLRGKKEKPKCKEFENLVARQLEKKLTGRIFNVGDPRVDKRLVKFKELLVELGLDTSEMSSRMRDGGLDILWVPPLGADNMTPIVAFQCKNAVVPGNDIKVSASDALATMGNHRIFRSQGQQIVFSVVNTFLEDSVLLKAKSRQYAFLGLAELLQATSPITLSLL